MRFLPICKQGYPRRCAEITANPGNTTARFRRHEPSDGTCEHGRTHLRERGAAYRAARALL